MTKKKQDKEVEKNSMKIDIKKEAIKISYQGNYIDGRFVIPEEVQGSWKHLSPADLSDDLGEIPYSYEAIDAVVDVARKGFSSWRTLRIEERAQALKKYQDELKKREKEFSQIIAREIGKPLWEAKTEWAAMVAKIDITINESMRFVKNFSIENIQPQTIGHCRYRPHGVMVVVGPFNFPGHLANGHIVPALLTGNSVIFKPSEKSPLTGQLMAECFHAAGFPPGVFNVIQGEKETSRRLCIHKDIDGILFTGSYEVGTRLKQDTLQQPWKILALEMGGKNSAIVFDDAHFEAALRETLTGAYLTTGQRCSATSRVLVHRSIANKFVKRFHEQAKAFAIDHPFKNPFIGSLIDQTSQDRYMKFMGIAEREGFEVVMRGKRLELDYEGYYVAPSICWKERLSLKEAQKSFYQQNEIFGPNVSITAFDSLEEAVALANVTSYGLVASVFTEDYSKYEKCWDGLRVGLVNLNKSTVGASSSLPFGGLNKSGNHFPTAVLAAQYCTYPVASLEVQKPDANPPQIPGLNWISAE